MRKYLLLVILLLHLTFAFGQTSYGGWNNISCYKGFLISSKSLGYVQSVNKYSYQARIKSNYSKKVTFNMYWTVGGERLDIGQVTLNPGEVYEHTSRYFNANAQQLYVGVEKVNFSDKLNCYADCDNGTPNQPDCGGNTGNTSNNSSGTTQQNDLTEYNRSKAALERQMQEENQRRQQQANQTNNQRQQYINVYNQGVALGNTGKYSDAAAKYQQAIGLATNDAERQQAQNAYNRISKANTQTQAINQISSSLMDLAKAMDAAKEKKRQQRKEEEAISNSVSENSSASLINHIGLNDNKFKDYFSALGYKYMYHEGINNQNSEIFEGFYIDRCCSDHVNVLFDKGNENAMVPMLRQLAEFKEYITLLHLRNNTSGTGFSIGTNRLQVSGTMHGAAGESDYDVLLRMGNTPRQGTNSSDYASVLKMAESEAEKETEEGYRHASDMLEPYVDVMDGDDINSLGFYFWKQKRYLPAVKYYKMAGDKGNDWGNYNLAYCYQHGSGFDTNYAKAYEYYAKVKPSFKNIGETYHNLGHLCEKGANNTESRPDYNTAASYFTMGANSDNASCMLHLGEYYDTNGRLNANPTLAKYWFKKACDLKVESACTKLNAVQ